MLVMIMYLGQVIIMIMIMHLGKVVDEEVASVRARNRAADP